MLIQKAILAITKVAAHEAVQAIPTIKKKGRRGAFAAEEKVTAVVALHAINAFIEVLRGCDLHAIDTVSRFVAAIGVEHFLRVMCARAEVAI